MHYEASGISPVYDDTSFLIGHTMMCNGDGILTLYTVHEHVTMIKWYFWLFGCIVDWQYKVGVTLVYILQHNFNEKCFSLDTLESTGLIELMIVINGVFTSTIIKMYKKITTRLSENVYKHLHRNH